MNLSQSGLPAGAVEKLRVVFRKHPEVKKVILYGSRAMGNFKPGSDIDLTIYSDSISMSQLLLIETEIDDLLLPYKVDLSIFSQIENAELREHIQRVGVVFY